MTLKTLKDIKLERITQFPNDVRKEIRNQAIKWLKDETKFCDAEDFMEFHNITESDLK